MHVRRSALTALLVATLMPLFFSGCCFRYSFTDASVPEDIKTVSIDQFPNYAPLATPTLSQAFTEALRDFFLTQTNLQLVRENGDIQLEGEITGYSTTPVAIQGNETAAQNRLKVTVNVRFTNTKDETQNFESPFTGQSDYSADLSLTDVEEELLDDINQQLVQDIFNRGFSNW
ncbi:MAG: LptE family protein [Salibacteraceae bacterium]